VNANNDLQLIVEKKYPIIKNLVREIGQKKGCYFSRMTGSGSVCYGVFESEKTAKVASDRIKSKYPKFWFSVAKTI
jgi:4-diphosphocytidyl-2-C-methyl-D-erythritol kinase